MRWIVDFESSDGELMRRELRDVTRSAFGLHLIDAFCTTRQAWRSFNIDRLVQVIDAETGELIKDVRPLLGLPPLEPPDLPIRSPISKRPANSIKGNRYSSEVYSGQRRAEKLALRNYYVKEPIWEHYRLRLLAQFDNRCFRCGVAPPKLDLDHHWPMILGGHLAPGNIVPLCRACNVEKRVRDPTEFYGPDELARLELMLERQRETMAFVFERGRWYASSDSRKRYLLSLGFEPALVREMFQNANHPWFQGEREQRADSISVTIGLTSGDGEV